MYTDICRLMREFDREIQKDYLAKKTIAINLEEKEDGVYCLTLDMPGATKDNVEITYKEDVLRIEYKVEEKEESKDKKYLIRQRSYSGVQQLNIPDLDINSVTSSLENGVLQLTYKLQKDKPKVHKIEIK